MRTRTSNSGGNDLEFLIVARSADDGPRDNTSMSGIWSTKHDCLTPQFEPETYDADGRSPGGDRQGKHEGKPKIGILEPGGTGF